MNYIVKRFGIDKNKPIMKTIRKYLLFAIFIMTSVAASAQTEAINNTNKHRDPWGTFRLSYNRMTYNAGTYLENMYFNDDFEKLTKLNGFSGEIRGNFPIKESSLHFQLGIGFSFARSKYEKSERYISIESKIRSFSMYYPLNIAYKLSFDNVSFMPYFGIRLNQNWGKYISEVTIDDETETYKFSLVWGDSFNSPEIRKMYGDPFEGKFMNFGWQIGADLIFDNIALGFSYLADLNDRMKDTKAGIMQFTIGFKL